jgi:SAM-dependent methyltransferase
MQSIHPFPARMAPEICRDVLTRMRGRGRVLDPMCGSGTVLRNAVELGHDAVGVDMDPLAVLLSRAWTTPIAPHRLVHDACLIAQRAADLRTPDVTVPWKHESTQEFAEYWFADQQRDQLARLSTALRHSRLASLPFLWVCLSRLIITKDTGASLARDVSHSRPHKVTNSNYFDCYSQFLRAARLISARLEPSRIHGSSLVVRGDARQAASMRLGRFDVAITSPPYLNAIDYIRGHRLSLIWFGEEVDDLRKVRADEIGAERISPMSAFEVTNYISTDNRAPLPDRYVGWLNRYASDMLKATQNLCRVVKPGGQVVVVVGNSLLRGATINNAGIIVECGKSAGLKLVDSTQRAIPARRRYLPIPANGNSLAKRMREETVLVFEVPTDAKRSWGFGKHV